MVILGITDSFTSGAAVIIDGRVVAAVNEERLDRNKMSMGFPRLSISEVIRIAGVSPKDIDRVAVATVNLFWREQAEPYKDYFRESKSSGLRDQFLALGSAMSKFVGDVGAARKVYYGLKRKLTGERRKKLPEILLTEFGIDAPVKFIDHHVCHAASAYFTSGMETAKVITQDGAGDGKCSRVFRVDKGKFEEMSQSDSYDSVGNYYSYVTHLCGFQGHKHEGKITGLAAYGKPNYLNLLEKFVSSDEGIIKNIGRSFDDSAIAKLQEELPENFSKEDLSASVQELLEESVSDFCRYWVNKSGFSDVALAGGVFANVKLNQRIHEIDNIKNVFVHPGMGDDGLAVGAALFEHNRSAGYKYQPIIEDVYLGADITPSEVEKALKNSGLKVIKSDLTTEKLAAKMLAEGKVIARAAGRMEYGPRALGNRTIMYQSTDPSVNQWLNDKLNRTEFMPFAPVALWEERHNWFKNIEGAEETARFMTVTFDCKDEMIEKCPAVCHIDGTARPQLIKEENNASYYQIVKEYQRLTGLPCVINTSFNMHEEPIVNNAEQAVAAFKQSGLDALILGDLIVEQMSSAN